MGENGTSLMAKRLLHWYMQKLKEKMHF